MARIQRSRIQGDLGPKLNEEQDPQVWIDAPGAPVARLANERPAAQTIAYDELIRSWQE